MITVDDRGKLCLQVASSLKLTPQRQEWDVESPHAVVELKTSVDFAQSLTSGHMKDQVRRLIDHTKPASLVIVGSFWPLWLNGKYHTVVEDVWTTESAVLSPMRRHQDQWNKRLVGKYHRVIDLEAVGMIHPYPVWFYTNKILEYQASGLRVVQTADLKSIHKVVEAVMKAAERTAKRGTK